MNKLAVARCFNRASQCYRDSASLQRDIGIQLMYLLDNLPQSLMPSQVLDVGCGVGDQLQVLQQYFTAATIIGVDLAWQMLTQVGSITDRLICGDFDSLPFLNSSIDLIYANMSLHWTSDWLKLLTQVYRVLTPGGVCLFSVPSYGSLQELQTAYHQAGLIPHVHQFLQPVEIIKHVKHQQFTILAQQQLSHRLQFAHSKQVLQHLKQTGVSYINQRNNTLMGKRFIDKLLSHLAPELTYQIFYLAIIK